MICDDCGEVLDDDDLGPCLCALEPVKPVSKVPPTATMRANATRRWDPSKRSDIELTVAGLSFALRDSLLKVAGGGHVRPTSYSRLHDAGMLERAPGVMPHAGRSSWALSALGHRAVDLLKSRQLQPKPPVEAPAAGGVTPPFRT